MPPNIGSPRVHPSPIEVYEIEMMSRQDHDVAVMEEPVERADGGGVFGQEPAPGLEGPV